MERTPNATQDESNYRVELWSFPFETDGIPVVDEGGPACWGLFEVAPQLFF
jgi:hypothetical protein